MSESLRDISENGFAVTLQMNKMLQNCGVAAFEISPTTSDTEIPHS